MTDPGRAARMTEKALGYGQAALCVRRDSACDLRTAPFEDFEAAAATLRKKDVPAMYALGSAWAAWIQVRQDDFEAVAQLARVQALMNRVLELDEAYMGGGAHLYLGVLKTLIPPAMGGRPEEAREHFERVIQLSEGRNLMAKVLYARQYAKMMFDRELHDRLLNEVLATERAGRPGYTLTNMWAREMAQKMLSEADDYFFLSNPRRGDRRKRIQRPDEIVRGAFLMGRRIVGFLIFSLVLGFVSERGRSGGA